MRLVLHIIIIGLLAFLSAQLGWWHWDFVIIAFGVALALNANGWSSFLGGFLAIAVLWFFVAMGINDANAQIFSDKVAQVLKLSNGGQLLWITAIVGGLVSGFAALTGSLLRQLVTGTPNRNRRKRATWRAW